MSEFIPRGDDGHVHQKLWVWSPETIDDIQTKAELGRYTNRGLGTTRRTPRARSGTTSVRAISVRCTAARRLRWERSVSIGLPPRTERPVMCSRIEIT